MPLVSDGPAPYGPVATVMDVIRRYRERGLQTPFDLDVLSRAGVSESLGPRVILSLRHLDLIDESGAPTDQFERLRRAPSDEFRTRLEELVRYVYADVFQFADPTTDSAERVADAFRQYNPAGQRNRMVTLFLGLCQEAGIIEQAPQRTRTSRVGRQGTTSRRASGQQSERAGRRDQQGQQTLAAPQAGAFPPELTGLLNSLPARSVGWTKDRRDKFLEAFGVVLDFVIPVREAHEFETASETEEEEEEA